LPDRAVALRAADGKLTVLTWDGSLVELDGAGKVVKRQTVQPDAIEKAAKELQPAPDAGAVKAAQKHAPAGRVVTAGAPREGVTAVAYWGGTVQVLGADGAVRTSQLLPQDLAGMAWLDGKLVVGLADGQVVALNAR